jgi:hypothetical protein
MCSKESITWIVVYVASRRLHRDVVLESRQASEGDGRADAGIECGCRLMCRDARLEQAAIAPDMHEAGVDLRLRLPHVQPAQQRNSAPSVRPLSASSCV